MIDNVHSTMTRPYPYLLNSLVHFNAFFVHSGYLLTCIVIILTLKIIITFEKKL